MAEAHNKILMDCFLPGRAARERRSMPRALMGVRQESVARLVTSPDSLVSCWSPVRPTDACSARKSFVGACVVSPERQESADAP